MEEPLQNINPIETDKVVAKAVDEENKPKETDNLIRLSTGVILKAKQANPSALIRVMTKQKRPTPPLVDDPGMGRKMENAMDPDYIKRVQAWELDYSNGMLNVLIGLGTELHSKPDNIPGKDDESWLADYRALELPTMENSPAWRYITWVMFVAAPTAQDLTLIGDKVKALSGTPEEEVRKAETFPEGN